MKCLIKHGKHIQGNKVFKTGEVVDITETTFKNCPDKFEKVVEEVKAATGAASTVKTAAPVTKK